ncbi:hypothetical protein [Desemzia sp. FAM 23989]|uniref:hypothetical protein n=1 Tax=Desemzia sp. FAM 23989 TaxID=3259523 RepID=UPI003889CD84
MVDKVKKIAHRIFSYLGEITKKASKNMLDEKKAQLKKRMKISAAVLIVFFILSFIVTIDSANARQDELSVQISDLQKKINSKNASYNVLESENNELEANNKKLSLLKTEYEAYKEKMTPYEELEKSEADAKKAEADAKNAELKKKEAEEKAKKEAEEKAAAEEKKAKAEAEAAKKKQEEEDELARIEAEEAKGYETGITFDQLARTPDDYFYKKVKFSGKVVQVMEGEGTTQIRFAVDDDYDKIIYAEISSDLTNNDRLLEDDYVTLSGISMGLLTYESTMGGEITIPSIVVDKIDR